MKKYHLTITDNETGEIMLDVDTGAIIGAYAVGDGAMALGLTCANAMDICSTIKGAQNAIQHIVDNSQPLAHLISLLGKLEALDASVTDAEADGDEETTENN